MTVDEMPIRDADLRYAVWKARCQVGDEVWEAIRELQQRRDKEGRPLPESSTQSRSREIL